jgi:hypothetical protein
MKLLAKYAISVIAIILFVANTSIIIQTTKAQVMNNSEINKIIGENSAESMNTSRLPPSSPMTSQAPFQAGREVTDSLILGLMNNPDFANVRGHDVLDKCLPFQDHIKDRLARGVRTFNPTVDHSLSESCAHALWQVKENCERDTTAMNVCTDPRYENWLLSVWGTLQFEQALSQMQNVTETSPPVPVPP